MPRRPADDSVFIHGAQIIFRNFSGAEGQYNRKGSRNFCVVLSPEDAANLSQMGYNVKQGKAVEIDGEIEPRDPYLQIKINMESRKPPIIVLITSRGRTNIGEDELTLLDSADIVEADVKFGPYHYDKSLPGTGVSAYLRAIYVTIEEDEFMVKYADVPRANSSAIAHDDDRG